MPPTDPAMIKRLIDMKRQFSPYTKGIRELGERGSPGKKAMEAGLPKVSPMGTPSLNEGIFNPSPEEISSALKASEDDKASRINNFKNSIKAGGEVRSGLPTTTPGPTELPSLEGGPKPSGGGSPFGIRDLGSESPVGGMSPFRGGMPGGEGPTPPGGGISLGQQLATGAGASGLVAALLSGNRDKIDAASALQADHADENQRRPMAPMPGMPGMSPGPQMIKPGDIFNPDGPGQSPSPPPGMPGMPGMPSPMMRPGDKLANASEGMSQPPPQMPAVPPRPMPQPAAPSAPQNQSPLKAPSVPMDQATPPSMPPVQPRTQLDTDYLMSSAQKFMQQGDMATAKLYLARAAEQGDPQAQALLSQGLASGPLQPPMSMGIPTPRPRPDGKKGGKRPQDDLVNALMRR